MRWESAAIECSCAYASGVDTSVDTMALMVSDSRELVTNAACAEDTPYREWCQN